MGLEGVKVNGRKCVLQDVQYEKIVKESWDESLRIQQLQNGSIQVRTDQDRAFSLSECRVKRTHEGVQARRDVTL